MSWGMSPIKYRNIVMNTETINVELLSRYPFIEGEVFVVDESVGVIVVPNKSMSISREDAKEIVIGRWHVLDDEHKLI